MTEKQFNGTEINQIIKNVFNDYIVLYQNGRMNFKEFAIIENILIKLEMAFKEIEND